MTIKTIHKDSVFETQRTSIELLDTDDCSFILSLVNSKGWLTFIGDRNIHDESQAGFYIKRILDNPDITYWVVKLKKTNAPIGIVTLIQREYLDFYDIGFAFLPEFENQGLAFESTSTVLKSLLTSKDFSILLATTIPDNVSSIKLLKKLGFTFEKEISINSETLLVYKVAAVKTE